MGRIGFGQILRNNSRRLGKTFVILGVSAIFVGGLWGIFRPGIAGTVMELAGVPFVMLGCHLWVGRNWIVLSLFVDVVALMFMASPLSDLVGRWSSISVVAAILLLFAMILTGCLSAKGEDDEES